MKRRDGDGWNEEEGGFDASFTTFKTTVHLPSVGTS